MTLRPIERIAMWFIRARVVVVVLIALLTVLFGYFAIHIHVETRFDDLMPQKHPYINVHQEFKQVFGGSNMASIMIRVKDGDIFNLKTLGIIRHIQKDLLLVNGVNEYQIISLASQKLRDIKAGTYGIERTPLMWPHLPKNQEEIKQLKEKVLSNRLVYGSYVSRDLKAANLVRRRLPSTNMVCFPPLICAVSCCAGSPSSTSNVQSGRFASQRPSRTSSTIDSKDARAVLACSSRHR